MKRWLLPTAILCLGLSLVAWAGEAATPRVPRVGETAPAWRLNDHEGRARTLADARTGSWVVLAFFPKADTPG